MNFMWNGKLWQFQQDLFDSYVAGRRSFSKDEIDYLKANLPIKIARWLAPSNLVIRHLCLLDLMSKECSFVSVIKELVDILAYNKKNKRVNIWAESYAYWAGDTRPFLIEWVKAVNLSGIDLEDLKATISEINNNFRRTSYERNGVSYPAPFGDVWDCPLEDALQQPKDKGNVLPVVRVCDPIIKISTKPIGFNMHTDTVEKPYDTTTGIPIDMETDKPFKFYKGYEEKYPTKWSEIKAMLSIKRFLSAFKLIFERESS